MGIDIHFRRPEIILSAFLAGWHRLTLIFLQLVSKNCLVEVVWSVVYFKCIQNRIVWLQEKMNLRIAEAMGVSLGAEACVLLAESLSLEREGNLSETLQRCFQSMNDPIHTCIHTPLSLTHIPTHMHKHRQACSALLPLQFFAFQGFCQVWIVLMITMHPAPRFYISKENYQLLACIWN